MSFEKRREIASLIMRVFVSLVLIYSGYLKIIEPREQFIDSILSYKIVGEKIALIVASFLPWFELYLGIVLLAGIFVKITSAVAFFLFIFFELILLQAMIRGLEIANCGCFGASHSNPIQLEFMLNLIWIVFAYLSFKYSYRFSLDFVIEKRFGR